MHATDDSGARPAIRVSMRQRAFPPRRDFSSLSVVDLLEAREAHHVQLSSLENVVATAVGRYLIHKDDWYASNAPDKPRPKDFPKPGPRTLDNSLVRPWSWPCVLVFVRDWFDKEQLGSNLVPRALYMPDGRVIPTCVVLAPPDESAPPLAPGPAQVSQMVGGGYACTRLDQGIERVGSFGCLVYKGGTFYALTSRHVAGEPGKEIRAYVDGEYCRVGDSVDFGLTKLRLAQAFPALSHLRGYLNFDAGLVRLDNFNDWTSQVFGIGEVGEPFIATAFTLSLDLIGTPVRAFGGTSGAMEGEIRALFFQPRSTGGLDSATDVLIGPRADANANPRRTAPPLTRPGDSGTLWFYDPPSEPPPASAARVGNELPPERGDKARRLMPIAIQWGGQRFLRPEDGSSSAFALGSFLSTVLRELDLEVEREWSTGHDEYWGKTGHFAVGWKACELLAGKLSKLMKANQKRIGFGDNDLGKGKAFKMGVGAYVPLADVPDYVWIKSRNQEPIQHFADIDIQDIDGGPTMLQRCHDDPANCSAKAWKEYFDGFAKVGVGPEEGALPFRVWQIWEAMVAYVKNKDVIRFVAAAGVLAHYIGDASQPLHCSWLHHGMPPLMVFDGRDYPAPRESADFKAFKKTAEAKIHSIYEQGMFEVDAPALLQAVNNKLAGAAADPAGVATGHEAAVATVNLMFEAQARLSPKEIIAADDPTLGPTARAKNLWSKAKIRNSTVASLADSVQLLATLWASAWAVGDGDTINQNLLVAFEESDLEDIYRHEKDFIPSISLKRMASSGDFEPPP